MRVVVFEHICGGGMAGQALPPELLSQGGAMLAAVVEDLLALGLPVSTLLDRRVSLPLRGAEVVPVDRATEVAETFVRTATAADAVWVIAPEFDGILESWLRRLERLGRRSLGSTPDAARTCGDKLELAGVLQRAGVATPAAYGIDTAGGWDGAMPGLDANEVAPCGWVVKPRCGAGCEHTRRTTDLPNPQAAADGDGYIVQPFASGVPASAGVIVHGDRRRVLPPGVQRIAERPADGAAAGTVELSYAGGTIPLDPSLARRAAALADRAVAAVPGLGGFVGVDLVLGEGPDDDRVIEINPRLTVSYVGLRALCRSNPAAVVLDPDAPLDWQEGTVTFSGCGNLLEAGGNVATAEKAAP